MTTRGARIGSTAVFAAVVAFTTMWGFLNVAFADAPRHPEDAGIGLGAAALGLAVLFVVVGGLIVRRYPRNAVGWIFCLLGLVYAEGLALGAYAWISLDQAQRWPFTVALAWVADVTFQSTAVFGLFVFFFLLFPDGKLPSPRWRALAYIAAISITGLFVNNAFRPDTLNVIPVENPLGLEALQPFRQALDIASFSGLVLSLFGSVASLVVRLRRSRGDERQQIKWFLTSAGVLTTMIAIAPFTFFTPHVPQWLWPAVLVTSLSLIPIAAGVAILKYRLYEIDVIINRALVYAGLTGILAATYLTIVVVLQRVLHRVTADSDIAVAASTLAVAALARPLRSRVQGFIDKRFYRRKYDAAATLQAFSSRLRDEVDLEALSEELVAVVRSTMQPAHASLWLRPPTEGATP